MPYTVSLPAITIWERVEPRPRSDRLGANLAAQVRDPLWFLARQWQVGELSGADAGSPAFVSLTTVTGRINGVTAGSASQAYDARQAPLEPRAFSEPFSPDDLSLQVEIGQLFRDLLDASFGSGSPAAKRIADAFLAQFPVASQPSTSDFDPLDGASRRFAAVCGDRSIDGVAVFQLGGVVPTGMGQTSAETDQIGAVLTQLDTWVADVWGKIGTADPAGWVPSTLAYNVQVSAAAPSGGTASLPVQPDPLGEAQWSSFDLASVASTASETVIKHVAMIPVRIRFPGMPALRFWDFESSEVAFPSVHPELRDVAKLLALDFMLIHGQDWFEIPLAQDVGTISRIDAFTVTDVFGRTTVIDRADKGNTAPSLNRWTAFTNTAAAVGTTPAGLGDFYLATPSAAAGLQGARVLEQVRFARDEMANMAFGIEQLTPNRIGQARRGRERNAAVDAVFTVTPPHSDDTTSPLRYLVESQLPVNYIPLVGVRLAPNDINNPAIILEKAAHVRSRLVGNTTTFELVEAAGRILNPQPPPPAYQIVEEEVPRIGTAVERVVYRARWIDGSTHLWIGRRRRSGGGEVASGLAFDSALDVER